MNCALLCVMKSTCMGIDSAVEHEQTHQLFVWMRKIRFAMARALDIALYGSIANCGKTASAGRQCPAPKV